MDGKIKYFRDKIIAHLEELEKKENAEKKELKKSLIAFETTSIEKSGYPVGTIREWKGKKYIKIAPGKWKPKYDSHSRGAKMAISAMKKKIDELAEKGDSEGMLRLILENKSRFSDENGRPLPFVQELSDYVSGKNDEAENKKAKKTEKKKARKEKKGGNDGNEPPNGGAIAPERAKRYLSALTDMLTNETGEATIRFTNNKLGKIELEAGETGKSGYGLKHIIEQRFSKDGKSAEEIAAMIPLVIEAARTGEITRENGRIVELQKNGIVAIVRKESDDKNSKWVLTGFSDFDKEKEATDAMATVIADQNYAHEFSSFRNQVGAVIESISQSGEKSSGKPSIDTIRDKYQKAKSVTGNRKTIHVGDEKIKCHYKLVEADTPTASHDENTFHKTPGFPTVNGGSVNDNDYENSAEAKESVYRIAGNYDGRAIEDPPILTKDGIVVSGNNRTMSSKLAAKKGTDKEYIKELAETIEDYGIDEDELKNFKNPRLVLEIDEEHKGEYTTQEFAKYNKSGKKEKSVTEKAVVIAKTVKPEAVESIAGKISEFDTLGELYNDKKAAQDLVNTFIQNGLIQANEVAQYYDNNGLSANGKEFIETVLVGSIMNENNIRALAGEGGKSLRQKLVRGIVPLIENKGHGNEYSFNDELNKAVGIAAFVSKNHDTFPTIRDYLDQNDMFEEAPSELTRKLAEIVHDSTQKQFAEQMKEAEGGIRPNAAGEMDIFLGECESRDSVLERILKYGKNAIKKAVAEVLSMIA